MTGKSITVLKSTAGNSGFGNRLAEEVRSSIVLCQQ